MSTQYELAKLLNIHLWIAENYKKIEDLFRNLKKSKFHKCLQNPKMLLGYRSIRYASRSNLASESLEAFKKINSKDADLMLETNVITNVRGKAKEISLFDFIQDYKRNYFEKLVCMDPKIAQDIAKRIKETSEGDDKTPFLDSDGCLCLVSRKFKSMTKRPMVVLHQDDRFMQPMKSKLRGIQSIDFNIHAGSVTAGDEDVEYYKHTIQYK